MKIVGVTWSVIALIIAITPNSTEEKSLTTTAEVEATTAPTVKQEVKTVVDDEKIKEEKEKEETKAKLEAENKAKAEKEVNEAKEKQKTIVLDFEKSVYALEGEMKPYMEHYQKAMSGLGDGSVDIFTAYEATETAKNATTNIRTKFRALEISEELPKDVRKMLSGAKDDISTAYYSKGEALKAVMKFLDDQKPSHMSKFNEEIAMSDSFVLSGVSKILEAKIAVGIDLAETK